MVYRETGEGKMLGKKKRSKHNQMNQEREGYAREGGSHDR